MIDYLPFVTLLLALYTAGGGVLLRGGPAGTPHGNTAMLALGMAMGAVMGTTGASMVLIHPLLRANAHRRRKVHLVLFLIVLVANASGASRRSAIRRSISACCTACRSSGRPATCSPRCWW